MQCTLRIVHKPWDFARINALNVSTYKRNPQTASREENRDFTACFSNRHFDSRTCNDDGSLGPALDYSQNLSSLPVWPLSANKDSILWKYLQERTQRNFCSLKANSTWKSHYSERKVVWVVFGKGKNAENVQKANNVVTFFPAGAVPSLFAFQLARERNFLPSRWLFGVVRAKRRRYLLTLWSQEK